MAGIYGGRKVIPGEMEYARVCSVSHIVLLDLQIMQEFINMEGGRFSSLNQLKYDSFMHTLGPYDSIESIISYFKMEINTIYSDWNVGVSFF